MFCRSSGAACDPEHGWPPRISSCAKQLALYLERHVKPRRANNSTRLMLVVLSGFIDWRQCLTIVQPDTLVRWHRDAFRLFWRRKSRPRGRPRIPRDLQRLIIQMEIGRAHV